MECAHNTIPCPHQFEARDNSLGPQTCDKCGLSLRYCPECDELNRIQARFCTRCGQPLDANHTRSHPLAKTGEMREAASDPPGYSLNDSLGLTDDDEVLFWLGSPDGVFVLGTTVSSPRSPACLYWIPAFVFGHKSGQCLSDNLPAVTEWIQRPLVSAEGVFIACRDRMHFFPAHGYSTPFPEMVWKPTQSSTKLLSFCFDGFGNPVLATARDDGEVELLFGNTQAGDWQTTENHVVPLSLNFGDTGLVAGHTKLISNSIWLYDGRILGVFNTETGQIDHRVELQDAAAPHSTLESRFRRGYFDPFIFNAPDNQLSIVYPCLTSSVTDRNIKPAVIKLNGASSQSRIFDDPNIQWVQPDPNEQGFFVGTDNAFKYYEGNLSPSFNDGNVKPQRVPPTVFANWVLLQLNGSVGTGGNNKSDRASLQIIKSSQIQGKRRLKNECRLALPNTGLGHPGMPPLSHREHIFVALSQSTGRSAPIKIYDLQILQD